ncbi:CIA30 family protein [Gelidibacter salicanalis]|uniref:CIA30 family protein n=1 Tax=Gelidibacter salicanalis TaxID=291193 RepID=A0A934KSM0_9FLAO|nr:CIA30 family protein [Gelidibacter salicanalis]MBJ7882834.1 CIA30 family protein [Gelidibacter salicanalis]
MTSQDNSIIYDFQSPQQNALRWHVVNDGVMGGLSKSKIALTDGGNGLFEGTITTENNGGFASVKHSFFQKEVSQFNMVKLRIKGDGKSYQFRIKSYEAQQYSYVQEFKTSGEWQTITLYFDQFYASYRGNTLGRPNYDGKLIEEVTFLIGNKRNESFALEIERIWLE